MNRGKIKLGFLSVHFVPLKKTNLLYLKQNLFVLTCLGYDLHHSFLVISFSIRSLPFWTILISGVIHNFVLPFTVPTLLGFLLWGEIILASHKRHCYYGDQQAVAPLVVLVELVRTGVEVDGHNRDCGNELERNLSVCKKIPVVG